MFFGLFYTIRGIKINYSPKASFDEYFTGETPDKEIDPGEYTEQILITDTGKVYVHDIYAHDFQYNDDGSAIYCTSTVLVIEKSTFFNCKSTNPRSGGGAVYFYNDYGQFIISKTCGYNCGVDSSYETWGQFAYSFTGTGSGYKNQVIDSTIASCSISQKQYSALYMLYGEESCQRVNLSKNTEFYQYTALYSLTTSSSSFKMTYSSIVNNTGSQGIIGFPNYYSVNSIETCNIINNDYTGSSYKYGVIHTIGELTIKDSCMIMNNQGKRIILNEDDSSTVQIINCTFDISSFYNAISGEYTIINPPDSTFIVRLEHSSTGKCEAYLDERWIYPPTPDKTKLSPTQAATFESTIEQTLATTPTIELTQYQSEYQTQYQSEYQTQYQTLEQTIDQTPAEIPSHTPEPSYYIRFKRVEAIPYRER